MNFNLIHFLHVASIILSCLGTIYLFIYMTRLFSGIGY